MEKFFLSKDDRLDLVREMASKGITRKWLAEQIGKSNSLMGRFLKYKYDFPSETQKKIKELVDDFKPIVCETCGCPCKCNK